jgi:hypothetical protein
MIACPKCGHENLPSYPTCSRCGGALASGDPARGGPGAPAPLPSALGDEATRRRRNLGLFAAASVVALAVGAFLWMREARRSAEAQAKLHFYDRFVEIDKTDTGAFWACVMAGQVDMRMFSTAAQIQARIESAYATQSKDFDQHLREECLPKLERARAEVEKVSDVPPEMRGAIDAYKSSFAKLRAGLEDYIAKLGARGKGKDVDALIQELGDKWHASDAPTPETIAFERFMHCAIPGLARMKNAQAMLELLADACFKKDAAPFMKRVREECGPVLQKQEARTPSKTWSLSKRFYEDEARQLRAWESCSKRARKGLRNEDLTTFLGAVGEYMKARHEMGKVASEIAKS